MISGYTYLAFFMLLFIACSSLVVLVINNGDSLLDKATVALSAIAILISGVSFCYSSETIKQTERIEKIRRIEKSLECFYRPLQNSFKDHEDNPITVYNKTKYDDVGCYKHLAEPNTFRCFEVCPQKNETLKELLHYLREDIHTLQSSYKQLKD